MNKETRLRSIRNHMQAIACCVDVNTTDYKKLLARIAFVNQLIVKSRH